MNGGIFRNPQMLFCFLRSVSSRSGYIFPIRFLNYGSFGSGRPFRGPKFKAFWRITSLLIVAIWGPIKCTFGRQSWVISCLSRWFTMRNLVLGISGVELPYVVGAFCLVILSIKITGNSLVF